MALPPMTADDSVGSSSAGGRAAADQLHGTDDASAAAATSSSPATNECAGSPLVRISTFCSPRSDRARHRRRKGASGEATRLEEQSSVAVSISILDSVPCRIRKRIRRRRRDGDTLDDPYATIYVDDPSLLVKVGAFEGTAVCCLSAEPFSRYWSPVVIRILPKKSSGNIIDDGEGDSIADVNSSSDGPTQLPTIYVPPCVAASAGLHDFAPSSLWRAYLRPICSLSSGVGVESSMRQATKAVVREVAAPPLHVKAMCSSSESGAQSQNTTAKVKAKAKAKADQDESLRRYFTREAANGMREDSPRVACVGSLFAVPNIGSEGTNIADMRTENAEVRFYEVISITSTKEGENEAEVGGWVPYVISLGAKLVLQENSSSEEVSASWPRRLPRLTQALKFSASAVQWESVVTKEDTQQRDGAYIKSLHPSLNAVVDSLLLPISASPQAADFITLLVGSDDDRVQECVSTAADSIGMRFVPVDGLAAFDYRYKKQNLTSPDGDAASHSNAPVTGSLTEKLSGLQAAIGVASKSAPCVLFVGNIDKELTAADVDAEMRADEEKRFMTVLTSCSAITARHTVLDYKASSGYLKSNKMWGRFAPPILVVLSSSKHLPRVPLSALSVRDAIRISRPDEQYARQLWSQGDSVQCQLPLFEDVRSQLLGRTANEIVFARKEMMMAITRGSDDEVSPSTLLQSIFDSLDKGPCVVSAETESRLSSALIPNTKWEDVGGLAHVRTEVMDAIELPLRHPHLFKGGGGRSGILLFGPPGTGKTLVAKAVATECGLPFLSVKGPELLGSYVGESEANVRAAFESAREAAAATAGRMKGGGAILFFDELDSIAPRRGGIGDGGGVMERVVATLLGEMDSGPSSEGDSQSRVFVIGATNRPDLLDPSLLRPGRFDRLVYLGLAQSREDRIKILAAQTRKFTFEGGQDASTVIDQVIDSIPHSLSGADLSAVAKGALMRSMRRLCEEADAELQRLREQSNDDPSADHMDIDTIVDNWDEDKRVTTVKAEDFIVAARNVAPSVGEKELANYEQLKKKYI